MLQSFQRGNVVSEYVMELRATRASWIPNVVKEEDEEEQQFHSTLQKPSCVRL